jgi:hypothetical protein
MATDAMQPVRRSRPGQIAPLWLTGGLLVLLAAVSLGLLRVQSQGLSPAGGLRQGNAPAYLAVIACEWLLVGYIWLVGRRPGSVPLRDLIGGRWAT